jgi:hypothetical protein
MGINIVTPECYSCVEVLGLLEAAKFQVFADMWRERHA